MARFQFAKSKALRAVLALLVVCLALASGLAYLAQRSAEQAQLRDLAALSERAGQGFADRFTALNADVLKLARRVSEVSDEVTAAPGTRATRAPEPELDFASEEGSSSAAVAPLEARWRQRLETSFRELAESQQDVLDITYLGRFAGVPNGRLMVVRLEREPEGRLRTTEVDPRPNWNAEYLQRAIQGDGTETIISAPLLPDSGDEARYAVMRGASSVRGDDGAVVGLVLISVELSSLLSKLEGDLPEGTVPLLVSDNGTVLLHPAAELKFVRADSASQLLKAAYPDLLEAFDGQEDAVAFSYMGGEFATQLLRFDVGGEISDAGFSLVLAAPPAQVQFPSATQLTELLGVGRVLSAGGEWLVAGAGLVVLALVAMLVLLGRRGRRATAPGAGWEQSARRVSALAERADRIEAENHVMAEAVDAADADPAAEAAAEYPEVSAAGPLDSEQEQDLEPPQVEEDHPRAEEAPPAVSPASLEPARELAATRNRLTDELAEARQRALDELAAARERFECELAHERERAIERLVLESHEALASEMGELEAPGIAATLPSIEAGEFDLRQLLTEVAAWMEGENHGRSSGFDIRCKRDVPNRLLGDPDWMGPLLVNLGRSAVRCSEGGPVELLVSCVDDGAAGVRLCFELRARDTGLESDASGRIRERRPSGLRLTEEVVESMHGELKVENRPGIGASVQLVLPLSLPG